MRRLLSFCSALMLIAASAWADYLEVQRPAILRRSASSDSEELGRAVRGDQLSLVSNTQRDGYYEVALPAGGRGWVYRTLVRRFEGSLPGSPSEDGTASGGTDPSSAVTLGALDASAFRPADCPPEGETVVARIEELNRLKNRAVGPAPSQVLGVPIEDLMFTEDDETRWRTDQAVDVVGYVIEIKPGGKETCNCGATGVANTDAHIELVQSPDESEKEDRFVVEVSPTWRRFMNARGEDWSTSSLKARFEGKWVRVRGWLFFDREHRHNALNTNPDGKKIWRRTAWEIHPVTAIEEVAAPVQ